MVVPLIEQAGLLPVTSTPAFGCRQDADGDWYMPTLAETFDSELLEQLNPASHAILEAIDRMSTDQAFAISLQFNRHDLTVLMPGAGGVVDTVDVAEYRLGYVPTWMHNVQDDYSRSMQTYLTRTVGTEAELVAYMQWFMARRDVTLSTLALKMNPMAGPAFASNWGYEQFPWPWQLADPEAIAAYTGQMPPSSSSAPAPTVPTTTPDSAPTLSTSNQLDGPPVFSPAQLSVIPGDSVDITVSLPPTTFGGGFALTLTLPPGVELHTVPQCVPKAACEALALGTDISESPGGETSVRISGLLPGSDDPVSFSLTVGVSEQAGINDVLVVTAELGFSSRSAPPNAGGEAELPMTVARPAA